MNRPLLRQNFANVMMYLLGAFSVLLLVSCALPYSSYGFSSSTQAINDVLNNPALRIPILIAGLALLLAGLWLVELIIALPGFVIGAIAGASIGTAANDGHFGILSILLAIVAGALGAWLALALFYLGVFLSGFAIGFIMGGSIGGALFHSKEATTIVGIVLGIFAGILAVALWQVLQVVISAGVGAALIGTALGFSDKPIYLILIWLLGIAVQSGLFKLIGPPKRTIRGRTPTGTQPTAGPPPASQS